MVSKKLYSNLKFLVTVINRKFKNVSLNKMNHYVNSTNFIISQYFSQFTST